MKITKKQLENYIQMYLDSKGDNVVKRNWGMMLIHRLQCDRKDDNKEHCSIRWKRLIEGKLEALKRINDFDELYKAIKVEADKFYGIGRLTTYDTATCIGFEQGVYPKDVYLHAGAAEGARALGVRGTKASKTQFVAICKAFEMLEPAQIEDFLCIYKHKLQGKKEGATTSRGGCC